MADDFRSLLSKPMDEIERPKPWPAGTYYGSITDHKFDVSAQKRTPYVRFTIQASSAGDNIDPSDLEGIDLSKKPLRKDYYLTEDALYRVKAMLESIGITTEGRALGECIPETRNAQVMFEVTQRNSPDGREIYNDVGDLVGVE